MTIKVLFILLFNYNRKYHTFLSVLKCATCLRKIVLIRTSKITIVGLRALYYRLHRSLILTVVTTNYRGTIYATATESRRATPQACNPM